MHSGELLLLQLPLCFSARCWCAMHCVLYTACFLLASDADQRLSGACLQTLLRCLTLLYPLLALLADRGGTCRVLGWQRWEQGRLEHRRQPLATGMSCRKPEHELMQLSSAQ
jgi:hypothetical protein